MILATSVLLALPVSCCIRCQLPPPQVGIGNVLTGVCLVVFSRIARIVVSIFLKLVE